MVNILDRIIKCFLYCLIFILPLFFLPLTISPVGANKEIFAGFSVLFLFLLWTVKTIISGKINGRWGKLSLAVAFFLLVLFVSAMFSSSPTQGLWGMNFEPDSLAAFFIYLSGFFLVSCLTEKKEIANLLLILIFDAGLLAILFLVQLFVGPFLPWDFAQAKSFNPVGTPQALAIFFGGAIVLIFSLKDFFAPKLWKKILVWVSGALIFAGVFFINYWLVWLILSVSLILVLWSRLQSSKEAVFDLRTIIFPLIILIAVLAFLFIKIPTRNLAEIPIEITPAIKSSFGISQKTIGQGIKNLFLGSGPASFAYDYDLYRAKEINLSSLWNLRFGQAANFPLTVVSTAGVLGILSLLFIVVVFFWQGLRGLIGINQRSQHKSAALNQHNPTIFLLGFYFLFSWFFYPVNFSLMFCAFLALGLFVAFFERDREILFTRSPQKTFFIMLLSVFLIVGIGVGYYKLGRMYAGAINFNKALAAVNSAKPDLDKGILLLGKAINLDNKNDNYLRNLSQIYLLKVNETLGDVKLDETKKRQALQFYVANAETMANKAVLLNPKNSQNRLQEAVIYENFSLLGIEQAEERAIFSYGEARKLVPQSPQIPFSLARIYLSAAEKAGKNSENYSKILDLAEQELNKAVELKPNFTPAAALLQEIQKMKQ